MIVIGHVGTAGNRVFLLLALVIVIYRDPRCRHQKAFTYVKRADTVDGPVAIFDPCLEIHLSSKLNLTR